MTRDECDALLAELKRLKSEGVQSLYISDEAIAMLDRAGLATNGAGRSEPAPELAVEEVFTSAEPVRAPGTPSSRSEPVKAPSISEAAGGAQAIPPPPEIELPPGSAEEQLAWLEKRVLECPVCQAHVKPGKKVVFGVGRPGVDLFFCGEAPGADEEVEGEPFVGPAGQLLTRIINAMGLDRSEVYIGNIMKWRPEMPTEFGNRPPTAEEMAFCLPYLRAQLEIVKPKVIIALGKTAVDGLLGPDPKRRMNAVRGKWFEFGGIPLMPTFHPSYLLRYGTNEKKREVWEDMLLVMERTGMPISGKQRGYFRAS